MEKPMTNDVKAALKNNIAIIETEMQKIIAVMRQDMERYENFYTTYYWMAVKMSNHGEQFEESDISLIQHLCALSEAMMVYAEQIEKVAEDILKDVNQLKGMEEWDAESLAGSDIDALHAKTEILYSFNQIYAREQTKYVGYVEMVKTIFSEKKKKTKRSKFFWDKTDV